MRLSLYIAKRYLFSKKSHNVINLISAVSVCGVALGTMAMLCTLSVFNGFTRLVSDLFTAFDPTIKITAKEGKVFSVQGEKWQQISAFPQIEVFSKTLEDNVMVQYKSHQAMVTLKGVEDNFTQLTHIKDILVGNGEFRLNDDLVNYGICGTGLISSLGCGLYFTDPLELYFPKRGDKLNLTNPTANFNKKFLYSPGVAFMVNQEKYDGSYIIASYEFARSLFNYAANDASAVEIGLKSGANLQKTKRAIEKILCDEYNIQDRFEQQEDIFKIMRIEKFISYLFLCFILLIACFNVIGSLSMLIIDKKKDVATLRKLGADNRLVSHIFIFEGIIISSLGAIIGILSGIALCLLQQEFGLITFGDSAGNFVVDAYPVSLQLGDIFLVLLTVILVGILSIGIPVTHLTKKIL